MHKIIITDWIKRGLNYWPKIPCALSTITKILSSTAIKTSRLAHTVTSSKYRWIVAYSIGLTILAKLGSQNKKKKTGRE
jgi:hypothetical protein